MPATLNEHIVTSYEDELTNLNKSISEMGGMVEQAITEGAMALLKLDHAQAQNVRAFDVQIDQMQTDLGALGPGVGADLAAGLGRALAGQDALGLGALERLHDLQHTPRLCVGRGRGDAHIALVAGGQRGGRQQHRQDRTGWCDQSHARHRALPEFIRQ